MAAMVLFFPGIGFSRDSKKWPADFQIGADIMSRYIWRGLNLGGTGPSIQPTLKLNVGNTDHMFSVGGWGAYTFGPTSNQEVDMIVSYTFKGMLTLMVATNFYGNDARRMKEVNDSTFVVDGLQYSTYIELGFKKRIKSFDFNAFVGGTVTSPDLSRHETGYYANTKAGFTTIGIKVARAIPVTEKYSIPIQASLIANPLQNKFYIVFGISF